MSLTPTEERLRSLLLEYTDYTEKMATETVLVKMRGGADFGLGIGEREDTQIDASGKRVDLEQIERNLRKARGIQ